MAGRKLETTLTAKDKTSAAFASVNRSVDGMKKSMLGVSAAIAVAVAGTATLVQRSLSLADSIDKASGAAGISAEGYQRLKFAAGQAGIATGQLDMSLLALVRRTGLAHKGNTTYAKTYDELGVSIRNVGGGLRDQEDILEDVLLALSKIEDQAELTAQASVLFGDDAGKKMALLLKDGIEGLNESRDRAEELRLVLSGEQIKEGVGLVDAFNELKSAADAETARVILDNAEALEKLTGWLGKARNWAIGVLADATTGFDYLGKVIGFIDKTPLEAVRLEANLLLRDMQDMAPESEEYRKAAARVKELVEQQNNLLNAKKETAEVPVKPEAEEVIDTTPLMEGIEADKQGAIDAAKAAEKRAADILAVRQSLRTETQMLNDEQARLNALMGEGGLTQSEATAALINYRDTLPSAIEAQRIYDDAVADGAAITEAYLDPQERLNLAIGELKTLLVAGTITLGTYNRAVSDLKSESILAADTMQGAMARAFDDIDYRMAEIDIFAGDMFGGMENAAKSAVNEIISEFYRLMVIKPLMDALFGDKRGEGVVGGLLGALLGAPKEGKAAGGHVSGGTAYLVGEEGPEIFKPNTSGDIIPNHKLGMSSPNASGVTVVQNIRFDVGLESVDQRIEQATPRIANESARAVRDAQQRSGGEYI